MNPGDRIIWSHIPRGGYGYVAPVPGVLLSLGTVYATIEVAKVSGEKVKRRVEIESIRTKENVTT